MSTRGSSSELRPLPTCRNCEVPMEPGFQLDRGDYNLISQAQWVPGMPTPPRLWNFGEATRSQTKEALRVVSFRCPECGLLDCYAIDPVTPLKA